MEGRAKIDDDLDFTNPCSFLLQLEAATGRIFYCPRSALKSFTVSQLKFDDVFKTSVSEEDLIVFLKAFNGDTFGAVKTLTVAQQQQLIQTAKVCGISKGGSFDSFKVLSDAIFDGDQIDWSIWRAVADYHSLDMYEPDDAIELLAKRGLCCWLDMELKDAGIANPRTNREAQEVAKSLLVRKFGPPKDKGEA